MHRLVWIIWSVSWLACASGLIYLRTQPVPEEWLLRHANFLRIVHEYERAEPAMKRWRAGVPLGVPLEEFWAYVAERPYALLPQGAIEDLMQRMSPDAVFACVRRIKALLLAPCSYSVKSRVISDPFGIGGYARMLISPALTSTHAALYVCLEGGSKESTLVLAETASRVLEELQARGEIGAYQDVTAFLATPDRQTVRFAEVARMVNSFELVSTLERAMAQEGVDREVLKGFLERMRKVGTEAISAESVTQQENRLRLMGLLPLVRYFFYRTPRGYMSVHRVLPASSGELRKVRQRLVEALGRSYLTPMVTGPEYFAEVYYASVDAGLWVCGVMWGLGTVGLIVAGTLREYLWRLVLGRRAAIAAKSFWCAPGYRAYFAGCGLRGVEDALKIERLAGVRTQRMERFPGDEFGPLRRWKEGGALVVELPLSETAPRCWKEAGSCRLIMYRGYGLAAEMLAREYKVCKRMTRAGVRVMPLVLFAEGREIGKRFAVLAYAWPEGYVPIVAWQAARLMSEGIGSDKRRFQLLHAVEELIRQMVSAGIRGLSNAGAELMVRELVTGEIRVRLSGATGLRRESLMLRAAKRLGFRRGGVSIEDLAYVNRSLLREVYGVAARVRALRRVLGVRSTLRELLPVIWRIRACSAREGYRQYVRWGDDLVINQAAMERLKLSPARDYAGFMGLVGERRVTLKRGRSVVTLRVGGETWYLKRHSGVSLWQALGRLMRGEWGESEAAAEWDGVLALEEAGIWSVPLVVMGSRLKWGFWERGSFIVTAEVAGGRSLEKVLQGEQLSLQQRIRLARRLGRLARRLHLAGLAHRDFYLGHVYVVGDLRGEYRLHVLDAQRVRSGARIGNRWSVKDVTALYYSSLGIGVIRDVDRMRFLCAYMGGGLKERAWRHRFARAVMRKAARVARHTEKLLARRRARGELP